MSSQGVSRILVVEDDFFIAADLQALLRQLGYTEILIARSLSEGQDLLSSTAPDLAILDVNLGSGTSAAVAEELTTRGIPFMLTTGYGEGSSLSETFAEAAIINKPYEASTVIAAVSQLMRRG